MTTDIASRPLSNRMVLLCLADLELAGSTPAHTGEVIRSTRDCLDAIDADTLGKLSEADIKRALNRLEADGLVEEDDTGETTPVGKGRPSYSLTVETTTVIESLADDDDVTRLAERVGERTG